MPNPISITACYAFVTLDEAQLQTLQKELLEFGETNKMRGLVLIAPEGINGTVSGSSEVIAEWKNLLTKKFGEITFKDSSAQREVFRRWFVKIKPEIVCIKDNAIRPAGKHKHLSPEEWQAMLKKEDVLVLDARNFYETAIGKFRGAVDPDIEHFHEFPEYVRSANLPKDKKILMYCTGGIRCEKALIAMEAQGYDNVYQLDGGILAYLEKFPHSDFEGECFVFDHRVAVDQKLQPSQTYELCPHCGDPGDLDITCYCGKAKKVCTGCANDVTQKTCCKQCRNILRKKLVIA